MKIDRVELYELNLPFVHPFIISGGTIPGRRSLLVRLLDDAGREGWGECPPFELPFYSEETLPGARDLLTRVLIPRVAGAVFDGPEQLDAELRRGIRGNPFARAALETAAWDLEAARRGTGMAQLLAERLGTRAAGAIPCGVALGIPEDRTTASLCRRVEEAVGRGYHRVKIKIAPGWDLEPVSEVLQVLEGTGLPLTVDANGSYEWPDAEAALRGLDDAGLLYIEQPLPPGELVGHAQLAAGLRTPVCLDETLRDAAVARQVIELGGPVIWNIKVHRVGGLSEVLRICQLARAHDVQLWAGTMPESGIGSQAPLAVAALPLCTHVSDLEPSARWFGEGRDVVELRMSEEGRMGVPAAGVGSLLDRERLREVAVLRTAAGSRR